MNAPDVPAVVVSAGFSKTHMTTAAREVFDRGRLVQAITGAYPTAGVTHAAEVAHLSRFGRVARLLERDEALPADRVRALPIPELLYDAARMFGRVRMAGRTSQRLCALTLRLYGRMAGRALSSLGTDGGVYHFRAGFGQSSIDRARECGMRVLCDHAIVHPLTLGGLISSRGSCDLAPGGAAPGSPDSLTALDQAILDDINRSDAVLVNSDFVRDTFLACGWPSGRVHVAYLGVDENFLRGVGNGPRRPTPGECRMLFAGRLERRKGADVLIEALASLDGVPWRLVIAGPVMRDVALDHADFLADPRVTVLGTISRSALAREMELAPVFVFPSYAEGSARVVFEALSCRCYVITTPNSGTIVENGVHGALVPPGEPTALAAAIVEAARDPLRTVAVGNRNGDLIRERYRQRQYGEALVDLYDELTSDEPQR